jgi:hypothetical protein
VQLPTHKERQCRRLACRRRGRAQSKTTIHPTKYHSATAQTVGWRAAASAPRECRGAPLDHVSWLAAERYQRSDLQQRAMVQSICLIEQLALYMKCVRGLVVHSCRAGTGFGGTGTCCALGTPALEMLLSAPPVLPCSAAPKTAQSENTAVGDGAEWKVLVAGGLASRPQTRPSVPQSSSASATHRKPTVPARSYAPDMR